MREPSLLRGPRGTLAARGSMNLAAFVFLLPLPLPLPLESSLSSTKLLGFSFLCVVLPVFPTSGGHINCHCSRVGHVMFSLSTRASPWPLAWDSATDFVLPLPEVPPGQWVSKCCRKKNSLLGLVLMQSCVVQLDSCIHAHRVRNLHVWTQRRQR